MKLSFATLGCPGWDVDQVARNARALGFDGIELRGVAGEHIGPEEPRYKATEKHPELERAFMVILGLENFEQFPEIVRHHQARTIPPTAMWGSCPTAFDPSQAPSGKHTAFMWEKIPYSLRGNPSHWDEAKNSHGRDMLDLWSQFAPNLTEEAVIDWFTRSPLDIERTLPNMHRGDLLVGSLANGQVGYNRPFPGAGQYRSPLFVCICAVDQHTPPGGNITGLCGYNAAAVIVADLGLKPWWNPPELEKTWGSLA